MYINIIVPRGDELDQLLYKLADQIVELQNTINAIKKTSIEIQTDLNLLPGAPETAAPILAPASDEDIDQVAGKLVEHIRNAMGEEAST